MRSMKLQRDRGGKKVRLDERVRGSEARMVCVFVCLPTRKLPENDLEVSKRPSDLPWSFTFPWNKGIRKWRESHEYLSISFKSETRGFTMAFKGHDSHTMVQNSHLLLFKPCYNSLTATKQSISSSLLQCCGKSGLKTWFCEICVLAAGGSVSVKRRLWVFEDITPALSRVFYFYFF